MAEKIVIIIVVIGAALFLFKKFKNTVTKKDPGCSGCNGCCSQKKDNKETCGVIIENRHD